MELFQEGRDAEVDGGETEVFVEDGLSFAALAPPVAVEEVVVLGDADDALDVRGRLA